MLTSFTVENFRSIKDRVSISFNASMAIKDLDNNGYTGAGGDYLLNTIAFYGANSCGKSNLFKAIQRMKSIVVHSVRLNDNEPLPYDPFLLSDCESCPTFFEISFIDGGDKFTYGFSYTIQRIEEEWLYAKFPKRSMKTVFKRNVDTFEIDEMNFGVGIPINDQVLNKNRLLLSLSAQLGVGVSKRVIEWIRTNLNIISGLRDDSFSKVTKEILHTNGEYKNDILSFIRSMDVGFSDVSTEQEKIDDMAFAKGLPADLIAALKDHPFITAYARHDKYNEAGNIVGYINFDIDEKESDGTRKLFNLAGPIMDTLRKGKVLFIDELDSQLHPLLTREIVSLFNSSDSNLKGAQLVFTTHDVNLLSKKHLRRDQVLFVEKDAHCSTRLTSMMDIKLDNGAKPRTDSNYGKNYLEGRYGAIPYYSNDFNWSD